MHARNPYRDPPRFAELAKAYPPLSPYIIRNPDGTSTIDFKNDKAQRCLTEALLHRDFGIKLNLPSDRLCPPIPNRLNYVLWIQDIIRSTYGQHTNTIRGIDIGTGASAIYPLLACTLEPSWCFAATEIDETSFNYAQQNVTNNDLQDRIHIISAHLNAPILTPLINCYDDDNQYHFTMCNPPFYNSAEDVERSLAAKELEPHAVRVNMSYF
ncbi:hypothetical protein SERLA73DRAFT_171215 [Serpula lacrymans var. lacrymans S7.3]|uniref:U6 small nuclear RNA (adenine-(43)-N(6))-methyltransferase n=2 Tax=Serpula lacrymans var. lacrymans TaxID=341189 RepID=F8QAN0_SERL3|nr:uncharacterized protein SERLADRAFT_452997 [Serpula lacrymans var. lacrymans S7.9]EGN94820.1 hypothetical protein SERLA73DRAFT_171215 [Serpula lacrymans var. lacrymans S7.3]EGO20320.1 hypothetical protein SERLADRAFT_452997 [Serpula lacrymans var. lacrymans S7.9]